METLPPVDNTHNSGNSEVKTSHPVDNTHNTTKPDVEMKDKKVCFSCTDTVLIYTLMV